MIGPRLRQILQIAAWTVIALAPVTALVMVVDTFRGINSMPQGVEWRFVLSLIYGAALPVVQGGVLLVLLSIDQRIQNRGA